MPNIDQLIVINSCPPCLVFALYAATLLIRSWFLILLIAFISFLQCYCFHCLVVFIIFIVLQLCESLLSYCLVNILFYKLAAHHIFYNGTIKNDLN